MVKQGFWLRSKRSSITLGRYRRVDCIIIKEAPSGGWEWGDEKEANERD